MTACTIPNLKDVTSVADLLSVTHFQQQSKACTANTGYAADTPLDITSLYHRQGHGYRKQYFSEEQKARFVPILQLHASLEVDQVKLV
jgi:hypothetical protein